MKYIFSLLLIASISFQSLSAKDKSTTIKGKVYEQNNGTENPLSMAYVYVDNSIYCTYTKKDGSFEIDLPKGEYSIKVSHMGYTSESVVVKSKARKTELSFRLSKNINNQLANQ